MNNIRVKFIRGEEIKYISHLDLMKLFERVLRRSGVPIAYSQGFNPHPNMVFGLPLSVGVTSEAEYADFELSEKLNPCDFIKRLNNEFPAGLRIIDAKEKNTKANIMASIIKAVYEILVSSDEKLSFNEMKGSFEDFMLKKAIVVGKEGKGGLKNIDIRPMIETLNVKLISNNVTDKKNNTGINSSDECLNTFILDYLNKIAKIDPADFSYKTENLFCLSAILSAGSKANLKPDLLVSAINMNGNMGLKLVKVHRTGLFVEKGGIVLDPLDDEALL